MVYPNLRVTIENNDPTIQYIKQIERECNELKSQLSGAYELLHKTEDEKMALTAAAKLSLDALVQVECLIEHQYTGSREAMSALQNAADDAQDAITALRKTLIIKEDTNE